ncbi:MAG: YdcF family protein [Acidobacteria bacterium]|nr:YdcF family protein [Acidobacteriota bacterium]
MTPVLIVCLLLAVLAPYGLIERSTLAQSDAIVVLSGSSTYLERAGWAAHLWREGRAPRIILTNDGQSAGWDEARQRNPSFAERAADELRRQGVPPQQIEVIPQVVASTHDEALLVRQYAQTRGLHSLQFVTSAYHTRRARWTLERVFAGSGVALGVDAPPTGQQSPTPLLWWADVLGWKSVPGEYLKFIYYRARY